MVSSTSTLISGKTMSERQHPVTIYLDGLPSPTSRRTMDSALRCVMVAAAARGYVDGTGGLTSTHWWWNEQMPEHLTAVKADLLENLAPTTVNRLLSAVRGVVRAAWLAGLIDVDLRERVSAVGGVPAVRAKRGRYIESGERHALRDAIDTAHPKGVRDVAILAVLRHGLRRAEVCALTVGSIGPGGLTVEGKGRRQRIVPLNWQARRPIDEWVALRRQTVADGDGFLFCPVTKSGKVKASSKPMDPAAIAYVLRRAAPVAGVAHITPHDFRRTAASDLLDAGHDTVLAGRVLGQSPNTTAIYDRRQERAAQQAVDLLDP